MAAPKKRRIPIVIDMTPMVDIAFLLLIFFMATTVFKKPEEVAVRVPLSHSANPLPETGIIVITIPTDNTILMTLDNIALDVEYELYGLTSKGKPEPIRFQPEEIVPKIERLMLRQLVNKVVLKADREAKYGTVEKVMQTLQDNDLLFVNLVTDLEGDTGPARIGGAHGEDGGHGEG